MINETTLPCFLGHCPPPGGVGVLTSRRSQPPLALSVPLSRFKPRVGGGSAFYVRPLMRTLIPLLLVGLLLGCEHPKPVAFQGSDEDSRATPKQVAQAKQRLHLLRSDMTDEQAFATIGVANCYSNSPAMMGGAPDSPWVLYQLRTNVWLCLGRETISKLSKANLDDTIWDSDEAATIH